MTTLEFGSPASGSDGFRGEVRAVVIDPEAEAVTHVVVEPAGRVGLARLVPLDTVDTVPGEVRIRCTQQEFQHLDPAEETLAEFVPGYDVPVQVIPSGWQDAGVPAVAEGGAIPRAAATETVRMAPDGEVEAGVGDRVHATDGAIGQLRGFRLRPASTQISHVLLREGHLWGRKDVAIPVGAVTGMDGGVWLSLSRRQVQDLPPAGSAA